MVRAAIRAVSWPAIAKYRSPDRGRMRGCEVRRELNPRPCGDAQQTWRSRVMLTNGNVAKRKCDKKGTRGDPDPWASSEVVDPSAPGAETGGAGVRLAEAKADRPWAARRRRNMIRRT